MQRGVEAREQLEGFEWDETRAFRVRGTGDRDAIDGWILSSMGFQVSTGYYCGVEQRPKISEYKKSNG